MVIAVGVGSGSIFAGVAVGDMVGVCFGVFVGTGVLEGFGVLVTDGEVWFIEGEHAARNYTVNVIIRLIIYPSNLYNSSIF